MSSLPKGLSLDSRRGYPLPCDILDYPPVYAYLSTTTLRQRSPPSFTPKGNRATRGVHVRDDEARRRKVNANLRIWWPRKHAFISRFNILPVTRCGVSTLAHRRPLSFLVRMATAIRGVTGNLHTAIPLRLIDSSTRLYTRLSVPMKMQLRVKNASKKTDETISRDQFPSKGSSR